MPGTFGFVDAVLLGFLIVLLIKKEWVVRPKFVLFAILGMAGRFALMGLMVFIQGIIDAARSRPLAGFGSIYQGILLIVLAGVVVLTMLALLPEKKTEA